MAKRTPVKLALSFRLKKLVSGETYPADSCAASRCSGASDVIDATMKYASVELPLCTGHWVKR